MNLAEPSQGKRRGTACLLERWIKLKNAQDRPGGLNF